jgi:hypothetical protein
MDISWTKRTKYIYQLPYIKPILFLGIQKPRALHRNALGFCFICVLISLIPRRLTHHPIAIGLAIVVSNGDRIWFA